MCISIRLAEKEDFEFFLKLKSEDYNIFWAGASGKPNYENLKRFFYDAVENVGALQNRKIYIIEKDNKIKIGHLYIIPNGTQYDLSIAILEEYCGFGYARKAIKLGLDEGKRWGFKKMVSSIREDNIASMKAYTACGVRVCEEYHEEFIPQLNKKIKMYYVEYDHE